MEFTIAGMDCWGVGSSFVVLFSIIFVLLVGDMLGQQQHLGDCICCASHCV